MLLRVSNMLKISQPTLTCCTCKQLDLVIALQVENGVGPILGEALVDTQRLACFAREKTDCRQVVACGLLTVWHCLHFLVPSFDEHVGQSKQ